MAFHKASAPSRPQTQELLSADNGYPERHIVIDTLRSAAPLLGLSASVVSTLDAMLSCLAPKRNHHTVFASNATLTFRRNGISDRTLRRHAALLQDAGLITRRDSPNRKRFTKHSRQDGMVLRFGFDLAPLFSRFAQIAEIAAQTIAEAEQITYLKTKIRSCANHQLEQQPDNAKALETLRMLRRKLSLKDCEILLAEQNISAHPVEDIGDETDELTGNDGQYVRHHQNSTKEDIDNIPSEDNSNIPVQDILTACPEAAQFALSRVTNKRDVIAHARMLAPMIGVATHCYEAAQQRLGEYQTAATLWAVVQSQSTIRQTGAYFRAITTGNRSNGFDPGALIERLKRAQAGHA